MPTVTPRIWLIAGPNGAGKTTAARNVLPALDLPASASVMNPDAIKRALRQVSPDMVRRVAPVLRRPLVQRLLSIGADFQRARAEDTYDLALNWLAVLVVEAIIGAAIEERTDVIAERVLSTAKYLPLVKRAKAAGFETGMIFVALQNPERHVERVNVRVAAGGHPVPADKIRARWEASHLQLATFAAEVDRLLVFSNDGEGTPELVAWKDRGPVTFTEADRLPRVSAALRHLT